MSVDPFGVCLEPECHDSSTKELPSFSDMAKGFIGSAKDVIVGVVQGEELLVTEELHSHRMNICGGCEFFRLEDKRCAKCGCFMEVKSRFAQTYCPIDKW